MEAELARTARREILAFVGLVLLSLAIVVGVRERRAGPIFALLTIPTGAVMAVLGIAGILGMPLTPVSLVVLPLVIGIGLDDCLFLVERYRETGDVFEAVARGGRALSITTATTVTGFGALAFSQYPALEGLGTLAVIGLLVCFAATILWLPALLVPHGLRRSRPGEATRG